MLFMRGMAEIQNLHPLFVHFPVALLTTSLFFFAVAIFFRNATWETAARFTLYTGTAGALVAVLSGLVAFNTVPHMENVHEIMLAHQRGGYIILAGSVALTLWRLLSKNFLPSKSRWFFLVGMMILNFILAASGDLGAQMVFLHGVGVKTSESTAPQKPKVFTLDQLQPESAPHNSHEHTH